MNDCHVRRFPMRFRLCNGHPKCQSPRILSKNYLQQVAMEQITNYEPFILTMNYSH